MYKYIALKYPEYEVDSIIEVEDNNTMDFIEFEDNISIFLLADKFDILPEIGQKYNVETQNFE
jgi:hypothetical protein